MSTLPSVMEFARAGKVRILAVTSDQRCPTLPDVPTFAESGYADLTFVQWFGFVASAGAPTAVVEQLNEQISAVARMPEVAKSLDHLGLAPSSSASPAEFAREIRAEHDRWRGIVQAIGFTPEA